MFLIVAPSHVYFVFLFLDPRYQTLFVKKVDVSLDSIIDYFQIVCILTYTVHVENIFESVFEWY